MESDEPASRGSIFERHAQTIIASVLLLLVVWAGNTLLTIRDDVTALKINVQVMETALRNAGDDRFRGSDWRREKEVIDQRFNRIEILIERHADQQNRVGK